MTSYTVYLRCLTGINQYRFFRESTLIGSGSAMVLPDFPVTLQLNNMKLCYRRDLEITLFPGINRAITEDGSGKNWGRVIWIKQGLHRLDTPMGTFHIQRQGDEHRIFRDTRSIGMLRPSRTDQFPGPDWGDWGKRLILTVSEPICDDLAVVLLAFPQLHLGL